MEEVEQIRMMHDIKVSLARQEEKMNQVQKDVSDIQTHLVQVQSSFTELDKRTSGWKVGALFLIGGGGILTSVYYFLTHIWTLFKGIS